jgi:Thymidylate synthase complementing protein
MITAKIIAHSVNADNDQIVTFELQYPRFIHGEVMTHRAFSRNAMSSRAIPVQKMIDQVRSNPAMPLKFMKNKPGMQATEDFDPLDAVTVEDIWKEAAESAAGYAERLTRMNVHKQFANRVLEPYQWMRTIVTATEWDNFFELRCHPDAQPEFQALAAAMRDALDASESVLRFTGATERSWHLPYVLDGERQTLLVDLLPKISAARCARVSYLTHDGNEPNVLADLALFDRLVGSTPLHASPIEHQAKPLCHGDRRSNNFVGWKQFRETYTVNLKLKALSA